MNLQKWGDEVLSNAITHSAWKAITASASARVHDPIFVPSNSPTIQYWFTCGLTLTIRNTSFPWFYRKN